MCDGVRPEQEHRKDDYQKYKENLLIKMLVEKQEKHLRFIPFPEFQHQAVMTIRTLFLVEIHGFCLSNMIRLSSNAKSTGIYLAIR